MDGIECFNILSKIQNKMTNLDFQKNLFGSMFLILRIKDQFKTSMSFHQMSIMMDG